MKIIVGTSGRINEILQGVPNEEFMGIATENEKAWVVLKSDVTPITGGEVQIVEKIVEVIKEVQVDNPVHIETIKKLKLEYAKLDTEKEEQENQIQTLQDALSDALNAEEAAKKEAEDLKLSLKTLKTKFTKLKNKFLED